MLEWLNKYKLSTCVFDSRGAHVVSDNFPMSMPMPNCNYSSTRQNGRAVLMTCNFMGLVYFIQVLYTRIKNQKNIYSYLDGVGLTNNDRNCGRSVEN